MSAQSWVTLTVGLVASIGVIVTWQQKNRADRRSEWWRRTVWAIECTFSADDVRAALGWGMLNVSIRSKLVTKDDSDVTQTIAEYAALGGKG